MGDFSLFGMTTGETVSNVVALLALVVASIAVYRSSSENIRANVLREVQAAAARDQASAAQSQAAAAHTHAAAALTQVEIEVQKMIEGAKGRLSDFMAAHSALFAKEQASLTTEEAKRRETLQQSLKQTIEGYLTVMDAACTRYETGEVRAGWFEREYRRDIRQLVEGNQYDEILAKPGHAFKTLMRVYHRWEDPKPSG
jgi:hypothetical protein